MLQISTGKFFGDGEINEEVVNGVLFSNYAWPFDVETDHFQLKSVGEGTGSINTFVVEFTNRFETEGGGPGIVMCGSDEALRQIRLLCSFYFQALFHADRTYVEHLTRQSPRHASDDTIPSAFVPRFCSGKIDGEFDEVTGFRTFVNSVLDLRRDRFTLLMKCLGTFFDAIESVGTNFDLGYSMFAYLLETLSVALDDGGPPKWESFPKSRKIDEILSDVDSNKANEIRKVLVHPHVGLTERFVRQIENLVRHRFYISEASGREKALPMSYLPRALENLYGSRSRFVHQLQKVHDQLRRPRFCKSSDFIVCEGQPFLTFSGLVRLTRHVLVNFVEAEDKLETEDIPWRNELPGIVRMEMAPEYWIHDAESFTPNWANKYLNGLLTSLSYRIGSDNYALPDMRNLMQKIEEEFRGARKAKRSMFAIYSLFNCLVSDKYRSENSTAFLEKHIEDMMCSCSIQMMAAFIFMGKVWPWPLGECVGEITRYKERRFGPQNESGHAPINFPVVLELCFYVATANRFLQDEDRDGFQQWMRQALLNAPGCKLQLDIEQSLRDFEPMKTLDPIFGGRNRPVDSARAWSFEEAPEAIQEGESLRLVLDHAAVVRWTNNAWNTFEDVCTGVPTDGLFVVDLIPASDSKRIEFTFFWLESRRWEGGQNFAVEITGRS